MDYDIVLNRVLALWRESGAQLNGEPKRVQYLLKQKRPSKITLFFEYGIPKRLLTPDYIYEIKTTIHGKVSNFADNFIKAFEYIIVEPPEAEKDLFRDVMRTYAPLVVSINNTK